MKQRHLQLSVALLLILALAIIVWKAQRSAQLAAIDPQTEPVVIPTEMEGPEPTAAPASEPVAIATPAPTSIPEPAPAPDADGAVTPPDEVESISAIIEAVNPMSMQDVQRAVRKLRELPPENVSAWFLQSLKEIGTSRPADRDRLVMVANTLQSKTDLPFWADLANRETPRFPEEAKVRNPPHPTLESRFVDMEQLQAIRNIGLLAREDRAARRVLMEIILKPNPSAHRTLHREQAYTALKEADLAASLRVLKQLAAEDELLKRL